ncbi:hypothetical protein, partial [Staphylococcus epidermidis]|uniref:hypothetical protein n=1 Tax=Staphylococcus epidermidis TaxID=1282 RepID=UPI001C92E9B6
NIKTNLQSISKNILILPPAFIPLQFPPTLITLNQNLTLISTSKYPLRKLIRQQPSTYIKQFHQRKRLNVIPADTIKTIQGKNNIQHIVTNNPLK